MFERQMRMAYLWLVLVVGMSLHAAYALSAIRYGVDVTIEGATDGVPWSNSWLKSIFYVLPMLLGVCSILLEGKGFRRVHFVASVLFLLSNLSHVASQGYRAVEPLPVAQTILLTAVALINIPLVAIAWRHMRVDVPPRTDRTARNERVTAGALT